MLSAHSWFCVQYYDTAALQCCKYFLKRGSFMDRQRYLFITSANNYRWQKQKGRVKIIEKSYPRFIFFAFEELYLQIDIPKEGCDGLQLKNARFSVSFLHLMRFTTYLHVTSKNESGLTLSLFPHLKWIPLEENYISLLPKDPTH